MSPRRWEAHATGGGVEWGVVIDRTLWSLTSQGGFGKLISAQRNLPVFTQKLFFFPHLKKFQFYPSFSVWTCFSDHLILGHKRIMYLFLPTA